MSLIKKLQEASVFKGPEKGEAERRVSKAWELKNPLNYFVGDAGEIVAEVPGTDGVEVHFKAEYTLEGVYDSQEGWDSHEKVVLKSFEILDINDEYDVVPNDEAMTRLKERINKDIERVKKAFIINMKGDRELR